MKSKKPLESLIITVRGHKVLMDLDLAEIYGVPTKRLNEQVKRNVDRFPEDFVFQLNAKEKEEVVANCDHLVRLKFSHQLPHAFTEHGAIMAAMVLNSPEAVAMSVFVVRAFMQMREQLAANAAILKRLAEIDKSLLEHDSALRTIWTKLQPLLAPPEPPKRRIKGFNPNDE
jgi:predicted component of type VI protein secretion system